MCQQRDGSVLVHFQRCANAFAATIEPVCQRRKTRICAESAARINDDGAKAEHFAMPVNTWAI